LPQLDGGIFLTDGGIETSLIYDEGLDLPDFAAFVLIDDPVGRPALERYFRSYVEIAVRDRRGIVLETPTWRANPDWGARLGYGPEQLRAVNLAAVQLLARVRDDYGAADSAVVLSGCLGPRGDGYVAGELMTPDEAARYHALQVGAFADSAAGLVTAITMTYSAEAIGVVRAAIAVDLPVVVSFTVETDGRLPSGETLREAVEAVDAATDAAAAYFMVNCAHPTHFSHVLEPGAAWTARLGGVRANASRMSHAELDEATELDAGDPVELAGHYRDLVADLPHLRVLGGCCGTSDKHIDAISTAVASS
jgi:S-methylmethionine-dependent homocysteine/selenocysteine methylase